jgi:hypothetical protein
MGAWSITARSTSGGRLAVVQEGKLTRLDPTGKQLARNAGLEWNLGGGGVGGRG